MRNLENRLKRLEAGNHEATGRPDPDQKMADLIWERRRRRLEASGQPVEERRRFRRCSAASNAGC
jgi:hypothetical protein